MPQRNVIYNRDHGKDTLLRLTNLRLDRRHFRTRGHLAAGTASSYHRAPAMHRHVMGAFLLGWCGGQTWQDAGQDRRHRPKQDGTNRNGHTNSAHSHQSRLLGGYLQSLRLYTHQLPDDTDLPEYPAVILVTSRRSLGHPGMYARTCEISPITLIDPLPSRFTAFWSNLGIMTETVLITRQNKNGVRRRGHLLEGLRFLANDPKAPPAQRLKAWHMLFALETDSAPKSSPTPEEFCFADGLRALADRLEEGSGA